MVFPLDLAGMAVGVIETIGGEEDRLKGGGGEEGQRIQANNLRKEGGGNKNKRCWRKGKENEGGK